MSTSEPVVTFREMLAYTDYLAHRWLSYFKQHDAALAVAVGGRTPTLRDLVGHIFQVELFFATFLLQGESVAPPTAPPPNLESPSLETLARMHQEAHEKLAMYINSATEERLRRTRTPGPATVSNRKILLRRCCTAYIIGLRLRWRCAKRAFRLNLPKTSSSVR